MKQKYPSAAILLASVINGAPQFLAMSTQDVSAKIPAGSVVSTAAKIAGGGGGGRPDIAQGAGKDASKIDAALEAGRKLIEEKLSG
jgi:alanyl-tRNA synthetase